MECTLFAFISTLVHDLSTTSQHMVNYRAVLGMWRKKLGCARGIIAHVMSSAAGIPDRTEYSARLARVYLQRSERYESLKQIKSANYSSKNINTRCRAQSALPTHVLLLLYGHRAYMRIHPLRTAYPGHGPTASGTPINKRIVASDKTARKISKTVIAHLCAGQTP
jgi:hypothetical protein